MCINEGEPKLTKTFLLGASTPLVVTAVGLVVPAIPLPVRAVQIGCRISRGSSTIVVVVLVLPKSTKPRNRGDEVGLSPDRGDYLHTYADS